MISGCFSFAILVASTTFVTSACFADPFVEWLSIATLASPPTNASKLAAEAVAIAASSSGLGFWLRAQSAKRSTPSFPYVSSLQHITKNEETSSVPGAVLRI